MDRVGGLAVYGIVVDEGALAFCSTEAEVRRLTSPEAVTGTEASRVEAGAEILSEIAVLGGRAAVAEWAIEAGAETVEAGGEGAERVGQGGEAIPVKDSRL